MAFHTNAGKFFLDLIFPSRCLPCRALTEPGQALCRDCSQKIKIHRTLFCGKCGARLPRDKKICHKDFPFLLAAAADYKDPQIRALIHGLKFRSVRDAALPMGELLVRYLEAIAFPINEYSLVPIPLGARRRRERGFNQAELIAEAVAKRFGAPLLTDVLRRVKETKPQSELEDLEGRRQNVAGCFSVLRLPEKQPLLIDDVTTSGATFREAAEALKSAGARRIVALAVAKA